MINPPPRRCFTSLLSAVLLAGLSAGAEPRRLDAFGDPLPDGAVARIGTTRLRHAASVRSIAFSPDGRMLASGSDDLTVRMWETATGKEVHVGRSHTNWVGAVAFAPDGKTLASAGWDGAIRLWNVASGREVRQISDANRGWINAVRFTADGNHVVASDRDGHVCLWDIATGQKLNSFRAEMHSWFTAAFSPDGSTVAAVGEGHTISLWDVHTGKQLLKLPAHKDYVYAAAFSPNGRYLASGGRTNQIHLWELATGQLVFTLPGQDHLLAFSPDGRTLASAGRGTVVTLWDLASGKERRQLAGHERGLSALAFARDGRLLATASDGGVIRLWDVAAGREKLPLAGHEGGAAPVGFLPDGRTLIVRSTAGLRLWEIGRPARASETWPVQERRRLAAAGSVMALSPDGKTLAAGENYRSLHLWDLTQGTELRRLAGDRVTGAAFAPDGTTVLVAGEYGQMNLWNAATGQVLRKLEGHKARAVTAAFAPDGKTVVTAGSEGDETLRFWDPATGKELRQVAVSAGRESGYAARPIAFSPSGRTIALGSAYGKVQLLDSAGRHRLDLKANGALAFSPDGKVLATGGQDRIVRLWELATGQSFAELRGHEGPVTALAFTSDGRQLTSGSSDNTVLLWDVRPERLLGAALPPKPDAKRLAGCWDDLAGEDAVAARQALATLAAHPAVAVPFLRERLRPVTPVPAERVRALVANLDADEFAARERALQELAKLGAAAAPVLREVQKEKPALETQRRVNQLLQALEPREVTHPPGATLQVLRAIQVLEAAGTPEARQVLEQLATGIPEAAETEEGKAALGRMGRRDLPDVP